MGFKVGDKVVLNKNSNWFHQQEFDNNGKPIPKIICEVYKGGGWDYETKEGYSYNDNDLEPYLENTEPQYEVY